MDAIIILLLIVLNGVFAMSEMALVSSRKPRLILLADGGNRGARTALKLAEDPGRFLSTIQVGITLIGILAGAYGGATLAAPLEVYFEHLPVLAPYREELAITIVVGAITYLSLIIGELVPKQIALKRAEYIASLTAMPMQLLSQAVRPLVWFLDISNKLVLSLLRVNSAPESEVSEEEVKAIIAEGTESGVLHEEEKKMLESVLRLDDMPVRVVMTPRQEAVWIDLNEAFSSVTEKIRDSHHSRYLVVDGSPEHIRGMVTTKDILAQMQNGGLFKLEEAITQPIVLPEQATVRSALNQFRNSTSNFAMVVDEYGEFQGILTFKDILEAIVGNLPESANYEAPDAWKREDGSWLVDGRMLLHEAETLIGIRMPSHDEAEYNTLGGFMMHQLARIPKEGDQFDHDGWRYEVMDMDNRRVDKVLVKPLS